jgi:energy-coupling factor transport system ATP-binding protein
LSFSDACTIEIDHLTVQFPGRTRPALQNIVARIRAGDVVAMTGPSGCGKTTLLRTLAGFIPDMIPADVKGNVRIERGDAAADCSPQQVPRIGLVQQDPDAQICTLGVRAEVAFGPENLCLSREDVTSRVDAAMEVMGILHLADRETTTLSGGEKQRLAVASILAMEPSVLLLDEPTAHMDPAGVMDLFELLRRLHGERGCTLVVAEHRLRPLAQLSPRLWVMDGGRLVDRDERRVHRATPYETRAEARMIARGTGPVGSRSSVQVDNMSFGYGENRLFERLSFSLFPGCVLGVIGPNGGGKTTLLRLLAGLERPQVGEIHCPDGARIGMVFQHPHQQIFERTVRREMDIGEPLPDRGAIRALKTARLEELSDAPPHSLSLGEQRRLTVLTAFRDDPPLLLLDEPFIGQDRENVAWIAHRIRQAQLAGSAICLVTHDIPMVRVLCDRLLYLGKPWIEGAPEDVFEELRDQGQRAFTPDFWEDEG